MTRDNEGNYTKLCKIILNKSNSIGKRLFLTNLKLSGTKIKY